MADVWMNRAELELYRAIFLNLRSRCSFEMCKGAVLFKDMARVAFDDGRLINLERGEILPVENLSIAS